MSRIYLLTLLLVLFLVASIFAVRLIGNRFPSPVAVLFTDPTGTPCDRPCLFGIRPGYTKTDEVVGILTSHPLARNFQVMTEEPFRILIAEPPETTLTIATTPDGLVDAIYLSTGPKMGYAIDNTLGFLARPAVVGDFVSLWGSPNTIMYQGISSDGMIYIFNSVGVSVPQSKTNADRLHTYSPVSGIEITSWSTCPKNAVTLAVTQWLGFTTIPKYDHTPYSRFQLHPFTEIGAYPCKQ